ncbi:MAG: DNA repair protein RadC [Tannerellaceae bacterium]|nr:DNA repair protein RadC [Tannerellaceae bacterium]
MDKFAIPKWAEEDRPREKLLFKGPSALSDAELIAILIRSGSANESAVKLSQRILKSIENNLNELAKVPVRELTTQFHGIGEAKALSIAAALELGKRRLSTDVVHRNQITSSRDVWELFYPTLADLPHEELWVLFLGRSSKILRRLKVSQGGISSTSADLRIILKGAIEWLASGIILCHNHPSGSLVPSKQDDLLTERLKNSAKILDISLLDHIILTETSYFSYADECRIL